MKCSFRHCFCKVDAEDEYCCGKCKTSDRSERPSEKCRCSHDRCDEDAQDVDDDHEDGEGDDEEEGDQVSDQVSEDEHDHAVEN